MNEFLQNEWVQIAVTIAAVIVVAAIVTHLATRFLKHVLMREDGILPSSSIFLNIVRATIWILAFCVVLDSCFGINVTAVIAAMGVGGIALSLGFQDTIANLVGGLQIILARLIKPGDRITVGGDTGVVTDITWRHVTLLNEEGETVIVPNAVVNKSSLTKLDSAEELPDGDGADADTPDSEVEE